jgi:hypothetical protein
MHACMHAYASVSVTADIGTKEVHCLYLDFLFFIYGYLSKHTYRHIYKVTSSSNRK